MQTTRPAARTDPKAFLKRLESFPNGSVIVPEGHDWLPRIFGRECTRIRVELRKGEAGSVSELARRLGRDRTAVQKDIVFLEVLGLVERRRAGRSVVVRGVDRPIVVTHEPL